mgnify:CR=1 FL=1
MNDLLTGDYVLYVSPPSIPDAEGAVSTQLEPHRVVLGSHIVSISVAMDFMKMVLNGTLTCFAKTKPTWLRRVFTPLGKMLPRLPQFADLYRSGYSYHPLLKFFFEEYRKHPIKHCAELGYDDITADCSTVSSVFDDFIATMRASAKEIKLRKRVTNWESKYAKNSRRIKKMEETMMRRYGRVVVIRLDLHHAAVHFTPDEVLLHEYGQSRQHLEDQVHYYAGNDLDATPLTGRVPFEVVHEDRRRLFANMKGKTTLFRHAVAYVWRIEFTPEAGYHLHLALFFDGSKVEKHEWLAEQVGGYWRDDITRGTGSFYNCNRAWDKDAPGYGLGVIHHYDTHKRVALVNALDYLCKRTQQVVVLPYEGCNLFGSGFLHRERHTGRGRPRTRTAVNGSDKGAKRA